MRIIVCGGRDYDDAERVHEVLGEYWDNDLVIVVGGARGADTLAEISARRHGYPVEIHRANWNEYGKIAGFKRNEEMARLGADLCIAFPGGRGTADMIQRAERLHIEVRRVP